MSNPKTLNRVESEYDMDMAEYEQFPKKEKVRRASMAEDKVQRGLQSVSEYNGRVRKYFFCFVYLCCIIGESLY